MSGVTPVPEAPLGVDLGSLHSSLKFLGFWDPATLKPPTTASVDISLALLATCDVDAVQHRLSKICVFYKDSRTRELPMTHLGHWQMQRGCV